MYKLCWYNNDDCKLFAASSIEKWSQISLESGLPLVASLTTWLKWKHVLGLWRLAHKKPWNSDLNLSEHFALGVPSHFVRDCHPTVHTVQWSLLTLAQSLQRHSVSEWSHCGPCRVAHLPTQYPWSDLPRLLTHKILRNYAISIIWKVTVCKQQWRIGMGIKYLEEIFFRSRITYIQECIILLKT